MRCQAQSGAIRSPELRASQCKELAHLSRQAREIPAAADIREQPDARLRHGKARVLRRHSVPRRLADADTAAHRDAIHEGDDRLGISEELMVHAIFFEEECACRFAVLRCAIRQHANVPTRAKAAPLSVIDHHQLDRRVASPCEQLRIDRRGPPYASTHAAPSGGSNGCARQRPHSSTALHRSFKQIPAR
jgi:hypothetical protein